MTTTRKPYVPQDDHLNRKSVHNNHPHKTPGIKLERPGVFLKKRDGSKAQDEFKLATTNADEKKDRYLIAEPTETQIGSDQNPIYKAQPHGSVTNQAIANADNKFAVNPSKPQMLSTTGDPSKGELCVLTWFRPKGAAWMKASDLRDGLQIATAATSAAHHMAPIPSDQTLKQTKPKTIKNYETINSKEAQLLIKPSTNNKENHWTDYLVKPNQTVNLCMNLPSKDAAPVAIDVLHSGQAFEATKHSEDVTLFKGTSRQKTEPWTFGYVGKISGQPDKSRSGWLPTRVLKERQ